MANNGSGLTEISLGNFTAVFYGAKSTNPVALPSNEVGEVQSVGDIADEATIVDVQAYGQKYLKKLVGSANASAIEIVCNYDPSDAGQVDLQLAYSTSTPRDIGILMKDVDGDAAEGTFNVFNALIASASLSNSFDETRTITFSIVPTNGIGDYTAWQST